MSDDKVEVRCERLTIPAYGIEKGDPSPSILREGGYWRIYPYTMLDDLMDEKRERTYSALVLENEFIRATVLPELADTSTPRTTERLGERSSTPPERSNPRWWRCAVRGSPEASSSIFRAATTT